MKKRISTLLVTMISTILYGNSRQGLAVDLTSQHMFGIPKYNCPLVQHNINELPITIIADDAIGNYPDDIMFIGNVDIHQGNTHLKADKVYLYQKQLDDTAESINTVEALGNVYYNDNKIIMKGSKAWLNLNNKDANVWQGDYQMVCNQGHGKTDLMKQRGKNRYTILKNSSFTSCPSSSNIWNIVGNEVIYDRKEQIIKMWNARFEIGFIPIFYSPYLQLPIGNKRHSGFLIPNIKYNVANYFEFYIPYYWNIAPNMDVTIIPHYIHKHGSIMWENEFRYLIQSGTGLMELHYLPSDKVSKDKYSTKGTYHRWLYYWQHSNVINRVWHFNANYTKISDPYYFNDFLSKHDLDIDGYTTQTFNISYDTQHFVTTISMRQFQTFGSQTTSNYYAKPQLNVNWYQDNIGPFDMQFHGEVIHFKNIDSKLPEATRVHFEPSINLPWSNNWINLDTKIKLMATYYQQKNLDNYSSTNNKNFIKSVDYRLLPQFKIDAKFIFERNINLTKSYVQTLEPRIQYLYIPYHNQSKINKYDSSILQINYDSLFRDYIYSGLDRIASANQITTGVTSRIFDDNMAEHFSISVGQIYYFIESRTGDDTIRWKTSNKTGSLVWANDIYWHITDYWDLHSSMQYQNCLDNIVTNSISVEYRCDESHMLQLTYHYTRQGYNGTIILPSYTMTEQRYNHGVSSQLGGTVNWSIADRWSVVGAYYFDTNTYKTANQKLELQYNSCCYAVRIGYERKFNGWNTHNNQNRYARIIGFSIELHGLNSNYLT